VIHLKQDNTEVNTGVNTKVNTELHLFFFKWFSVYPNRLELYSIYWIVWNRSCS